VPAGRGLRKFKLDEPAAGATALEVDALGKGVGALRDSAGRETFGAANFSRVPGCIGVDAAGAVDVVVCASAAVEPSVTAMPSKNRMNRPYRMLFLTNT